MSTQLVSVDKRGSPAMDRRRAGRATERVVAATAIGLAAVFVGLALVAVVAPGNAGLGPWLPVHLLLAGGATTAIAGVMPFFSAAITNAPPAPGWLRFAAVFGVAIGSLVVVLGRIVSPGLVGGGAWIAGVGGVVFICGLAFTGAATLLPLRLALGARRVVIAFVYGMAVLNVAAGATLASLLLLGWLPAVENWSALKPAHAWLNVFGFVSLVIAGTLLHLLPTVLGTRISNSRATVVAYVCVALGPPLAALGFIVQSDVLAASGALTLLVGAIALLAYAVDVQRTPAHWTTDPGWHRFTSSSMLAAIGWFVAGTAIAAWIVIRDGANASGWQLEPLVGPVFIGWIAQVLVGAWSHLVPAVGPGLPPRHARQRRVLGRLATLRLVALNLGVAVIVVAFALNVQPLATVGMGLAGLALAAAVALLAVAYLTRESGIEAAAR